MKIAWFDCFSGISGNMVLGALIDAGLEIEKLKQDLTRLNLSGYEIKARKVNRGIITGTLVDVEIQEKGVERHLQDILTIIESSTLPQEVKKTTNAIFTKLAEAEAKVHGTDIESIHFHEVGGMDAIIDIVGSVVGLRSLGIQEVYSSPLHLGTGFIECAHGLIPLPSPATLELVKGMPVYGKDIEAELVTPTGAAIITTVAKSFSYPPSMEIEAIGYGAGNRSLSIPNMLRVSIGEAAKANVQGYEEDVVTIIETNIDDMNPEFYDHVMDKLFQKGALDVFLTPVQMKKNRPVVMLSALVRENDLSQVLDVVFEETTTLGVRLHEVRRKKLARESIPVDTKYGKISVKVGKLGNIIKNISPEYEDCRRIAEQENVSLKKIYIAAKEAAAEKVSNHEQKGEETEGQRFHPD
jgi:hypothetical protein